MHGHGLGERTQAVEIGMFGFDEFASQSWSEVDKSEKVGYRCHIYYKRKQTKDFKIIIISLLCIVMALVNGLGPSKLGCSLYASLLTYSWHQNQNKLDILTPHLISKLKMAAIDIFDKMVTTRFGIIYLHNL